MTKINKNPIRSRSSRKVKRSSENQSPNDVLSCNLDWISRNNYKPESRSRSRDQHRSLI